MWVWMTLCSALILGVYDVVKKQALKRNGVLFVLLGATALSTLFLSPFLSAGSLEEHLKLVVKALLVTTSWVTGLVAIKMLPLTTVSTVKGSRPVFVVMFSLILFGERLSVLQWLGIVMVFAALMLLSRSSIREGIRLKGNRGVACMVVSVLAGATSALYDKYIMTGMAPLFVQSWANFYITAMLALTIVVKNLVISARESRGAADGAEGSAVWVRERFRWDWRILLIALLITISDALYFFSLKEEGALLSVISMMRRSSIIVTFICGAIFFKEHNVKEKALDLVILLAGVALLLYASGS